MLALTKAGRRAVIALSSAAQAAEAEVALHLSPAELAELIGTLHRLGNAFGGERDAPVALHFDMLDLQRQAAIDQS